MKRFPLVARILATTAILSVVYGCSAIERELLFHPTHQVTTGSLDPWADSGKTIGFSRQVDSPKNVWLLLPGNGGQAADRAYALPSFAPDDSVYVLEYPGYGDRSGTPSKDIINQAAKDAYLLLKKIHPLVPMCVAGESIGSGPACYLATLPVPPDKIVLVVPFDRLAFVARDHFPAPLVGWLLADDWDNIQSLSDYRGPVEIFGARDDRVIPVAHAKALAAGFPSAKFHLIDGDHNDWAQPGRVQIRNP